MLRPVLDDKDLLPPLNKGVTFAVRKSDGKCLGLEDLLLRRYYALCTVIQHTSRNPARSSGFVSLKFC